MILNGAATACFLLSVSSCSFLSSQTLLGQVLLLHFFLEVSHFHSLYIFIRLAFLFVRPLSQYCHHKYGRIFGSWEHNIIHITILHTRDHPKIRIPTYSNHTPVSSLSSPSSSSRCSSLSSLSATLPPSLGWGKVNNPAHDGGTCMCSTFGQMERRRSYMPTYWCGCRSRKDLSLWSQSSMSRAATSTRAVFAIRWLVRREGSDTRK
ncbi:hypothetical protein CC80DRAFT_136288 [Byssothecium circinans]|uniref:Uncharacterized protein n=1 Tax=Byssothecium circinans TaxID=147558 RepID=A0A6A5TP73_9PLEO|nr:hypothetical protein CC80DRAFT_136288 [Byssothecium circinans]